MAGGIITTGSIPKALWPGLKALYGTTYDQVEKTYSKLFSQVSSDKAYEEYLAFTGFSMAQVKPQGQSLAYDNQQQGFVTRLVNTTYALGWIATMEEMQDNQYPIVLRTRTKANAFSLLQAKEVNTHLIYNRAFNATYVGADGQPLCSTAHPNVSGGTFSNTFAVAADLSEASLEDATISIQGLLDDKGLQINVQPQALIVPKQEQFNATRILDSTYQSGTANNDINAMKQMGTFPGGIIMSRYLTAPHAWFIRTTVAGNMENGMIFQERSAPTPVSDNDMDTLNFKAGSWERYAAGWSDPRGLFGSNGP